MFKKLKDKITEEVKQSPLKSVQQLAQAVVSPSSSSVFEPSNSNDKFCIEEDDIEEPAIQSSVQSQIKPGGFTSVALRAQTTSPARDQKLHFRTLSGQPNNEADNIFPTFEPQPTTFHVQSDWESASEVEDRYSQLDHINKESLYDAYRKVYNRYNRMKNKYHELVTHYRQLEREKDKAKTVLTETQDKALLRISELREQCVLEQQAKAHLEEALRNEVEERDHIINTLKTKIQYLKEASDEKHMSCSLNESANLIDFTENTCTPKVSASLGTSFEKDYFEDTLNRCSAALRDKRDKIKSLLEQPEAVKKNKIEIVKNSPGLTLNDQVNEPEKHSKDEFSIQKSLINIISELDKEVEQFIYMKENYLQKEENKQSENIHLTGLANAEKKNLEERLGDSAKESTGERCNLDLLNGELDRQNMVINELKILNESLTNQLKHGLGHIEVLNTELNYFKSIVSAVEEQLRTTNENIQDLRFNDDKPNSCWNIDHDIFNELSSCVKYIYETKEQLQMIEDSKIILGVDLKQNEDRAQSLVHQNSELVNCKEQIEQLYIKKTELENKILENEKLIKTLSETINNTEGEYSTKLNTLKQENVRLNEENKIMMSSVTDYENNLQKYKNDLDSSMKIQNELFSELTVLRKINSDYSNEINLFKTTLDSLQEKLKLAENNYWAINESHKEVSNELKILQEKEKCILSERDVFSNNTKEMKKDLDNHKQKLSSALKDNDELSHVVLSLTKKYDDACKEKSFLQVRIDQIETSFHNIEVKNSALLQTTEQQYEELTNLGRIVDEVRRENIDLHMKIEDLLKEGEHIKLEYSKASEHNEKLLKELESLNEHHCIITTDKKNIQSGLSKLEKELLYVKEENTELSNNINSLHLESSSKETKISELQDNLHNILNNLSESEKSAALLLETTSQLTEEINQLNKQKEDITSALTETRLKLEDQQIKWDDINNKYNSLSSSFKEKCDDLEEKCQQVSILETDKQTLLRTLNETNALYEEVKINKNIISDSFERKVNMLKSMKQIQRNMRDMFLIFKNEIYNELHNIKLKIDEDLMSQIDSILLENKFYNSRYEELEYKNKKLQDSYNSKIKSIQEDHNPKGKLQYHDEIDIFENKTCNIAISDSKTCDLSCNNQSEINDQISFHQNKCIDLENNLKQALSVINCIRKYATQMQQSNSVSSDPFSEDWHDELNNAEGFNISRSISKLESFFNNYEIKYKDTSGLKQNNTGQLKYDNDLNVPSSGDSKMRSKLKSATEKGTIVNRYLADNGDTKSFNSKIFENRGLNNIDTIDIIDCLEKKNKLLFQNLLQIHEFHKLNLKSVMESYENKILEKYGEKEDNNFLEKKHMNAISEIESKIETLHQDLDGRGDDVKKMFKEFQQNKNIRDEEMQKLKNNYEKEMREQDKKWRNCLDRRLIEEEGRHKAEVSRLTSEWNIIRKELEKASRVAVSALESGSTSGEMLQHQVHSLTLQLNQLQEKRCDNCGLNIFPSEYNRLMSRSIQDCTEMEYLRNIMYTYMLGKEPLVLAKVLCALLKFDDAQTKEILVKEEQKITLLGQLGIL